MTKLADDMQLKKTRQNTISVHHRNQQNLLSEQKIIKTHLKIQQRNWLIFLMMQC